MSTLFASLADVLLDNPIVAKDASLVLRRRRTVAIWLLAGCAIAAVSAFIVVDGAHALRWYGTLNPVGDDMLVGICGIALAAISVLVPALASSSIAGEREQGTLPLLLVTGLSPLKIVVGKLVATLVIVAPFVALALPPLGYATVLLGVEVGDVVVAAAGIVASTIAAAAVGVFVSASTARARAAAPGALLAAVVPAFFCALPAFVVVVSHSEAHAEMRPLAVGGLVMAAVITVSAIYGAWSALAPRVVPRFARATTLFVGLILVLPTITVLLMHSSLDRDVHAAIFLPSLFVISMITAVYVATAACDRRSPAPVSVFSGAVAVFFAAVAAIVFGVPETRELILNRGHLESFVVAALHVAAATGIATLVARFRPSPVLCGVVGGGAVLLLMLVPAIAHELGNPGAVEFLSFSSVNSASFVVAVVFWSTLAFGSALLASAGRRRA